MSRFPLFPHVFAMKWRDQMPFFLVFWILSFFLFVCFCFCFFYWRRVALQNFVVFCQAPVLLGILKAIAPYSSTLAWKIPWTEEPGRGQSMGSLRVGHDWATSLSLFTFMHWRRKRQPTPIFLPGESQRRGSLVGCRLWGRIESDTTDVT